MGRQILEAGVVMKTSSQKGFSLVEVMFALGVLTTGVLGAAAVIAAGMQSLSSSPGDVIVTQKAAQAIEAVFAARDSHKLTWAQIRNVKGLSGNDNGIFLDGPQPLTLSGSDGLVNTADDSSNVESIPLPGPDRVLGTADDSEVILNGFTREIEIRDVSGGSGQLRNITVTVIYQNGTTKRTYKLTTYISAYS
jgi:prepilin-type N-terminal cleavage/methylation domain-containing protein